MRREGDDSSTAPESCDTPSQEEITVTPSTGLFACLLKNDPKPCSEFREDTVEDLKEQISLLIALLEQERRDYRLAKDKMKTTHKEEMEQLIQKYREEVGKLQRGHAVELQGLVTRGKSMMEEHQKTVEEKLVESKKELERLKVTFRAYKDSLLNKTNEKWKMFEAEWIKTHEGEKEKSLAVQNQKFLETAKKEKNELWLRAQQEMCAMQQKHSDEIKGFHRKYEDLQQDYELRKAETEAIQAKLAEKVAEMQMLKKAAEEHQHQVEQLQKKLLGVQKACEEKIRSVDAQYRQTIQTMRQDNADLRRVRSTVKPSCVTASLNKDGNVEPRPKLLFFPPECCYQIYRPKRKCLI